MDLEKLEKMVRLVQKDLEGLSTASLGLHNYPTMQAEIKNLVTLASTTFPEHKEFFTDVSGKVTFLDKADVAQVLRHVLAILDIEKTSQANIKEMKIFQSGEEKLKQAGLSFQKEDYPSTIHNLNTALELVLKDKVGIPTTITGVNTSNIIDVLVSSKVEPFLYLNEVRKHVLVIDNKIKHQGYCPSKIDCINGIKAMEELIGRLRNVEMKLTDEIRKKIYEGL